MSLPKSVYDALKAVLTTETRLTQLSEQVASLSDKVESNAQRLATVVQNHAARLARLEGKFDLLENTFAARPRRLPR
jgi:ABC-type transporter Mla subunit MlaD